MVAVVGGLLADEPLRTLICLNSLMRVTRGTLLTEWTNSRPVDNYLAGGYGLKPFDQLVNDVPYFSPILVTNDEGSGAVGRPLLRKRPAGDRSRRSG